MRFAKSCDIIRNTLMEYTFLLNSQKFSSKKMKKVLTKWSGRRIIINVVTATGCQNNEILENDTERKKEEQTVRFENE